MDPISKPGQLLEVLRKQLAESQKNTGASSKGRELAPAAQATGRPSVAQLQKKIREKLQRIDIGDPKAQQKSVQVFLESLLLWEFGEHLMDDPKFYALLDDVQSSMDSDPAVRENLSTLIARLR